MNTQIKEQILQVRDTGRTNMLDINVVQSIADELGLSELVLYLEDHREEYTHFIVYGD